MNTINRYFTQAELALAAYSDLYQGISKDDYIIALESGGDGLSAKQAENFATQWRVVDKCDGGITRTYIDGSGQVQTFLEPTGLSVMLFEEIRTGKQVVAVRGTQDVLDLVTDIVDIGILGTAKFQDQYTVLSAQVKAWLDDGLLQSGFTVTGHSLGGFLATNLALNYAAHVTQTYIYNAPGVTGVGVGDLLGSIVNRSERGQGYTLT